MTRVSIKFHEAALQQLLRESSVRADMNRRAGRVRDAARAAAPVETGEYKDKLHVERSTGAKGVEVLTITAGTDHDIFVEARHGILAKAIDAAAG